MTEDRLNPILKRPTQARIDLGALERNFKNIQSFVGTSLVMPIVKANAYGHGMSTCVRHLEASGAKYFGVAYLEEGIELRTAGVKAPILVLGGLLTEQIQQYLEFGIDITASSIEKLSAIDEAARGLGARARVHLKIDTGMERIGTHYYTAEKLLAHSLTCKHTDFIGVFSHLAAAEDADMSLSKLQLERFLEVVSFYEKRSLPMPLRHISCSGSILQMPECNLDLVRPGAALYGISPAEHLDSKIALEPVLSLVTKVVYFKVVKKDAGVSYGHTWHAPTDTRVVTLPIGYGDGFSTSFSNNAEVLIRGKRYPVVGRVCMDQLMVNLGPDGVAYNADEVVMLGTQDGEKITARELSARIGSANPRELLVMLNSRIPRVYEGGHG